MGLLSHRLVRVSMLSPVHHLSSNNGHVNIRTGPHCNGRRWLGLIPFSFTPCESACLLLTWETHGTRVLYINKESLQRQCDAVGSVLLGNLGSCHPCGNKHTTYLSIVADQVLSFMVMVLCTIMHANTKKKLFRNGLRS